MPSAQEPKAPKAQPEHVDRLGRPIELGNYVAVGHHNGLMIAQVIKLNPKMIKIAKVPPGRFVSEYNKYPTEMVVLDSDEMVFYILKNSGVSR